MPAIHADEPQARKLDRLEFGDGEGSARSADRRAEPRLTRRRGSATAAETTTGPARYALTGP
jgi:hypothetical protein